MSAPRLIIAGKDRSDDWGARLKQSAAQRTGPSLLPETHPEISALSLRNAKDEEAYAERFYELMRTRYSLRILSPPLTGGPLIKALRRIHRKLFSYGHYQIVAEQTQINEVLIMSMRFEKELNEKRIQDLQEQIDALKNQGPG